MKALLYRCLRESQRRLSSSLPTIMLIVDPIMRSREMRPEGPRASGSIVLSLPKSQPDFSRTISSSSSRGYSTVQRKKASVSRSESGRTVSRIAGSSTLQ